MRRRTLLSTIAGAGVLLAGCVDGGGSDPADGTGGEPTDSSTRTPTPVDAGSADGGTAGPTDDGEDALVVESMTLQHGLVVPETPDSIHVAGGDHRYLWVRVTTSEDAPALADLSLEVHPDEHVPLGPDDHRAYRTTWGSDDYYDGTRGTSLVLFELPQTVDAPRVAFRSPAGTVRATEAERERLGSEPPSMAASLEKRYDESPDEPVAVVVENEGAVDGRFLGAINRQGPQIAYAPVARVSVPVAAGEQRTVPVRDPRTHRTASTDGSEPDMSYHLRSLHGDDGAVFGDG